MIFKCITNTANTATRRAAGGNCIAEGCKTTFGQSSFSVIGTRFWNDLPTKIKIETDLKTFNRKVKHWLKENQICGHLVILTVLDVMCMFCVMWSGLCKRSIYVSFL